MSNTPTDPKIASEERLLLLHTLQLVCWTLAAQRDDQLPKGFVWEEFKYNIIDRAIEMAMPGFDGGRTTPEELRANLNEWLSDLNKSTGDHEEFIDFVNPSEIDDDKEN
jgi:hypothetical protein